MTKLLSKLLITAYILSSMPFVALAGVQTGGGYTVTGSVNPITSITTGGGYSSHAGGNPVSTTIAGGGYSVYGHPYYVAPTVVASGGGGGGGGGCVTPDCLQTQPTAAKPSSVEISACNVDIKIANPVRYGLIYKNDPKDVKVVEQFLNEYEGENLPVDGKYSRRDEAAVIKWQEKYAENVLTPWGLKKGTGYVFTTSIAQMKRQQAVRCNKKIPVEEVVIPSARACAADIKIANPIKFNLAFKNNPVDVRIVEQFLNDFEGEKLIVDGKYSRSDEAAVIRWQEKYRAAVLDPWGLKRGTGYVFTTSIAQMKRQQIDRCNPNKKFHVPIPDVVLVSSKKGATPSSIGKAQNVGGASSGVSCPYFTEYQSLGARNLEVIKIQTFLNEYMDAGLDITGFYGVDTENAVKAFQNKYADEILSSWGVDFPASGWWFKSTRQKANELVGCVDNTAVANTKDSPVSR